MRSNVFKTERSFETSVSGLHLVGPASAMSFGQLFRFVIGAEYPARVISTRLSARGGLLRATVGAQGARVSLGVIVIGYSG